MKNKTKTELAPVIVFAHQRPVHLKTVLDALTKEKLAPFTRVKIFVDGPKNIWQWFSVRKVISEALKKRNFRSQEVVARKINFGLARSIASGVTETIRQSGSVIVLEDDTVPLLGFLSYMNHALCKYKKDSRIFQVSGFRPPAKAREHQVQFSRLTTSWGWGTWTRAWKKFAMEITIPKGFQKHVTEFNFKGSYPFYRLLLDVIQGKSESWAIRWYFACFKSKSWIVYPPISYIRNIGFDGSGEHGRELKGQGREKKPVPSMRIRWPSRPYNHGRLESDFNKYLNEAT